MSRPLPPPALLALALASPLCALAQDAGGGDVPVEIRVVERVAVPSIPPSRRPPTITPITPPRGQAPGDRMLQYVHGLAGNVTAWAPVARDLKAEYETNFDLVDYRAQQDLQLAVAAADVETELLSVGEQEGESSRSPATETMYVGHSMGGIVGREILRQYEEESRTALDDYKYRGIVTFNSPHGGAMIANNLPEVFPLLQGGCADLAAGPVADATLAVPVFIEWVADVFTYGDVSFVDIASEFVDNTCQGTLFENALGLAVTELVFPTAGRDLGVGAPFMTELNGFSDRYDLPKALVYGTEQDPVALRLLSSFMPAVQTLDVYTAGDDTALEDVLERNIAVYEGRAAALRQRADQLDRWRCRFTGTGIACQAPKPRDARRHRDAADEYDRGPRWLERFNDRWKALIGAADVETVAESWRCVCADPHSGDEFTFTTGAREQCDIPGYSCAPYLVDYDVRVTTVPNDGIVTEDTQRAWPGLDRNRQHWHAEGSNHLQVRNDENTERAFKSWLFSGSPNDFFFTEPRQ